jgi:hypothetical protein
MEVSPTLGAFSSQKRDDQVRSRNPEPKISQPKGFCLASFVPGTKRIWSDLCCTFQHLTRWRWRCVPEGRRESRPAIYRRYWCFRICSRPGGTIEIFVAEAIQFSKDRSSLGHERRYSGVPPGCGPHVLPDPATNRRATVRCPSGTKNHLLSYPSATGKCLLAQ